MITVATYFVTLPVAGYSISGFPVPYVTFHPCCSMTGSGGQYGDPYTYYDNTYIYSALNFVADFALWVAIALAVAATFTARRLVIGAAAGAGATLLTLLLPPLASITPFGGAETSLTPLGFPYEYLIYYYGGLGSMSYSGYVVAFSAALADYALWAGVALATVGIALTVIARMRTRTLHADLEVPGRPPLESIE
jgi:hypothetical protein